MRRPTRTIQSCEIEATTPNLVCVTGLIYVILIAVWGVVLVPRWLRRHDEMREMGDPEALEAALHSDRDSSRRDSNDRYRDEYGVEEPGRGDPREHQATSWGEYLGGIVQVDYNKYTDHLLRRGSGLTSTARRRRKIVIGLGAAVVVSLFGAIFGVLPGSLMVLSTFLLAGYISAMVIFMRNNAAVRSGKRSDLQQGGVAPATGRENEASGVAVDGVRVVGAGTDSWDPRETTLPTYVTKPKASKIPRRIDLTSGWTGADMVAQAREQQASPELERQFDREWATVDPEPEAEVERYASGHVESADYYRRAVNE